MSSLIQHKTSIHTTPVAPFSSDHLLNNLKALASSTQDRVIQITKATEDAPSFTWPTYSYTFHNIDLAGDRIKVWVKMNSGSIIQVQLPKEISEIINKDYDGACGYQPVTWRHIRVGGKIVVTTGHGRNPKLALENTSKNATQAELDLFMTSPAPSSCGSFNTTLNKMVWEDNGKYLLNGDIALALSRVI